MVMSTCFVIAFQTVNQVNRKEIRMKIRHKTLLLGLVVLSFSVSLLAMTQHQGRMYRDSNGNVICDAWIDPAFTPRLVTVDLYSPSGALLDSEFGAATQFKTARAIATAAPIGTGTYTCTAYFEELTQPDEYDTQYYSLAVN
jgi:hypothetical protein